MSGVATAATPAAIRAVERPRIASLDALRALAVAGVLAVHFSPTASAVGDWGGAGVRLFFVLSGYLITTLLLDARARIDVRRSTIAAELRGFLVRRLLRLGPAYYATLFAAVALNIPYARESFGWHAAFLSNHYVILLGRWPDLLSHYWTLAVEFQFYLLWPFVILRLSPRQQHWTIATMLVVGPLTRWSGPYLGIPAGLCGLPFPGCLDMFGWGAAVALLRQSGGANAVLRPSSWLVLCAVVATTFVAVVRFIPAASLLATLATSANGAAFAFLLAAATETDTPAWSRWLSRCRPLVYLGTISYGIYLYHNFMHWVAPRLNLRVFGQPYLTSEFLHVTVLVSLTLLVSVLSWHFWERPIMRLRRQAPAATTR